VSVRGLTSAEIQKAASSLYEALGKSCSEHPLHKVHISLRPRLNETLTQVGFSVAFSGCGTLAEMIVYSERRVRLHSSCYGEKSVDDEDNPELESIPYRRLEQPRSGLNQS
jgi:hypothetical protein